MHNKEKFIIRAEFVRMLYFRWAVHEWNVNDQVDKQLLLNAHVHFVKSTLGIRLCAI